MGNILSTFMEVLVIDDEPELKNNIRLLIEDAGFTVVWCSNWNDAKDLLRGRMNKNASPPDVILVDMFFHIEQCVCGNNPAMEGILILEKLSILFEQHSQLLPTIIGYTSKLSYLQAEVIIEFGAHDFISEAEYQRPNYFAKRLIRSVLETKYENSTKPMKNKRIKEIEEYIVYRALQHTTHDLTEAANLLMWPVAEVANVAQRLDGKGTI